MARGVNKVILVGNVGADPEVRHTTDGRAIANLSVATSYGWRDKATGENREQTEWHRVVFFNRLAEIVQEYIAKGSQIYVEGRLQTRKWQDQSGNDRYTTEIVATEMQMLGGRNANAGQGFGGQQGAPQGGAPQNFGAPNPAQRPANAPQQQNQPVGNIDDFDDDDIPF